MLPSPPPLLLSLSSRPAPPASSSICRPAARRLCRVPEDRAPMTELSFLTAPGTAAGFIAETRPRAHGAGIDPYEYDRVTATVDSLLHWPDACRAAALAHRGRAERAAARGRHRTAGQHHRLAARWFHLAAL